MNRKPDDIDKQIRRYGSLRPADGFADREAFKAEFFRRAAGRTSRRRAWRLFAAGAAAAAILIAAVLGWTVFCHPAVKDAMNAGLYTVAANCSDALGRMKETLALFGSEVGVGYREDELFVFDRREQTRPSRLLRLRISDREGREVMSLDLAVAADDFIVIDTPQISGVVFIHQADRDLQVVDYDLTVKLADGSSVAIGSFSVLRAGKTGPVCRDGYLVEQLWLPLG